MVTISVAFALVLGCAGGARGQDIAQQVRQVRSGTLTLLFASKPTVCGDGQTFIRMNANDEDGQTVFQQTRNGWNTSTGYRTDDNRRCEFGPVRVELEIASGDVVDINTYVGGTHPRAGRVISARAAMEYLLSLAEGAPTAAVGERALLPALLADSVDASSKLLAIARNTSAAAEVRRSAIFWLGQAAGQKATAGLKSLLSDDDVNVRKQAVFALSQLRNDEGITALIAVVKNNRDPIVRKQALFWLGQSQDPRVLALFEDILLRK